MTWFETLAQNQGAGVLAFFTAIGAPLGTYLIIVRTRANAELKRAEADAIRAVASNEWQLTMQARVDLLEQARKRDQQTAAEWKRVALQARKEAAEGAELNQRQQAQIDQLIEELHRTTGGDYGDRGNDRRSSADLARRDRRPEQALDRRPDPVGPFSVEQVARREADRPREGRPGARRDDGRPLGAAGRDQAVPRDRERAPWPGPLGGGPGARKKT